MTLGFRARLNSGLGDESFGLDNFTVTRTLGTPTPVAFTPNAAALMGTDPHTRFPLYYGCPNINQSANWLTVRTLNLNTDHPLSMQRQARGSTHVTSASCPGMPDDFRYTHASPTFVFNYDNQGLSGTNHRLRMQTWDGSLGGNNCDATLLVRDPSGQWWFNSEISWSNYNARIDFANAPSGIYHVWVGHFASAACNTQVEFRRY